MIFSSRRSGYLLCLAAEECECLGVAAVREEVCELRMEPAPVFGKEFRTLA